MLEIMKEGEPSIKPVSQDLRDLLAEGRDWVARHPVAANRAVNLVNSLPTQPLERRQRIVKIAFRLYSRP